MARGFVLDPTHPTTPVTTMATRPVGSLDLAGKIVGLRVDIVWRSWDWIAQVWEDALVAAGADVRRWRSGARFGEEGDRLGVELAHWADEVDLAVVGLAN